MATCAINSSATPCGCTIHHCRVTKRVGPALGHACAGSGTVAEAFEMFARTHGEQTQSAQTLTMKPAATLAKACRSPMLSR